MHNRDEVAGKMEQVKGKVKQAVGDVTDNPDLHDQGVADEAAGEAREGFGSGRRRLDC